MNQSNKNKKRMLAEKFISVRDWIMDHNKIVMPLVLIVCVLITILVAVNANHKDALLREAKEAAAVAAEESEGTSAGIEAPVFQLEENAHPEVNNIIRTYYDAQASGDIETVSSLNTYLNDIEKIKVEEMSKYIESYPTLDVYTKPGLTENTYVAYVCSEVLFKDIDQPMPGMQTFYIGMDESGKYFINNGTYDDTIWNYIKEMTLQDDVIDLNNKIAVEYNELLAEDTELSEFIAYLKEKTNENVGEILAEAEQPAEEETVPEPEETVSEEADSNVVKKVRTTDVVNIRSSDSEEADKLDKAQLGQEFDLLEQKGNGWSKVDFNGKDAYIKSDYLEVISETRTDSDDGSTTETAKNTDSSTSTDDKKTETTADSGSSKVTGKVKAIDSVKVRKGASKDADSLGTIYAGEELDFIMKQADGWTKVKYKGETAYVKSEYVE